jgi:hypothetical protein
MITCSLLGTVENGIVCILYFTSMALGYVRNSTKLLVHVSTRSESIKLPASLVRKHSLERQVEGRKLLQDDNLKGIDVFGVLAATRKLPGTFMLLKTGR